MSGQRTEANEGSLASRFTYRGSRRRSAQSGNSEASSVASPATTSAVSSNGAMSSLGVPGVTPRDRKPSWLASLKRPKRFSFKTSSSSASKADVGREVRQT
eukprot:scpid26465/ scgid5342/ 